MNLIRDQWIPVLDDAGSRFASPAEVLAGQHRQTRIDSPRPEFRGAVYQFLIGLLQTCFAPETIEDWAEYWDRPPSPEDLRSAFEPLLPAFELYNQNGPAFMQDFDLPERARELRIDSLMPTTPGDNAIKLNKDLFIKGGVADRMCQSCTASALFAGNVNGIAAGAGYRVGIRGGGPLTTLPVPNEAPNGTWSVVWLSVVPTDGQYDEPSNPATPDVFPWLGPTRESSGDKTTHPQDVHRLQAFWAMPQRMRLGRPVAGHSCDLCGTTGSCFESVMVTNYGVSYGPTWIHPLSPYRVQTENDGSTVIIAAKGKQGGIAYTDWLALTLGTDSNAHAAPVVKTLMEEKMFSVAGLGDMRLWCFGYDAENAKVRSWFDETMPLLRLHPDVRVEFVKEAELIVDGAGVAASLLRRYVREAWFQSPKDARGDTSHIRRALFEQTEKEFFAVLDVLRTQLQSGDRDVQNLRDDWCRILTRGAENLFDLYALQVTDEVRNMTRIAKAADQLHWALVGPKGPLRKTLGR